MDSGVGLGSGMVDVGVSSPRLPTPSCEEMNWPMVVCGCTLSTHPSTRFVQMGVKDLFHGSMLSIAGGHVEGLTGPRCDLVLRLSAWYTPTPALPPAKSYRAGHAILLIVFQPLTRLQLCCPPLRARLWSWPRQGLGCPCFCNCRPQRRRRQDPRREGQHWWRSVHSSPGRCQGPRCEWQH